VPQAALDMCADFSFRSKIFNRDQILEKQAAQCAGCSRSGSKEIGGKADGALPASWPLPLAAFRSLWLPMHRPLAADRFQRWQARWRLAGADGCRLTIGRKKYADVEPQANAILDELSPLTKSLTRAIDEDAESSTE